MRVWSTKSDGARLICERELGIQPIQVIQANAFMVALITGLPAASMEVSAASRLATEGWANVLDRLHAAASELEADGIVSVQLRQRIVPIASGSATEFSATGTAVRGLRRREIWSTEADAAAVLRMTQTGMSPIRLVFGCCTWYQASYPWQRTMGSGPLGMQVWINQELPYATEATYIARETAMERMAQAAGPDAAGIVGVRIETGRVHCDGNLAGAAAGFSCFGTAVGSYPGLTAQPFQAAVSLND